jgi:hypothetical protein
MSVDRDDFARGSQPELPAPTAESPPTVLLLCRDLIFTSKIRGTAAELGYRILPVEHATQVNSLIAFHQPRVVFVDLTAGDLVTPAALSAYRERAGSSTWFVAFGPHVEVQTLAQAEAAGCQVVLPRSKFTAELPELIERYFRQPAGDV